jgi:ABC-type transport system involved in cytochrome c biogenesis permease subunit
MSALRRSRELIIGSWWRTIGIIVTAGLIAAVPAGALRFVWAFIPVIGVILTAATQAVSSTYSSVALVIYYFDQRCRTEDFDLRLLAEQVRSQSAPAMAAAPGSSSLG